MAATLPAMWFYCARKDSSVQDNLNGGRVWPVCIKFVSLVFNLGMAQVTLTREPSETDRQTVRELFYTMPLIGRGTPIFHELLWVQHGCPDEAQHAKILPDYCYHIFEVVRRTYFKKFPALTDIIYIKDQAALSGAKTIEAAKKAVQIDWRNLGRMVAIGARCVRFAELEAENGVDGEGFDDYEPERVNLLFTVIFGRPWVEANAAKIAAAKPDKIFADLLKQFLAEQFETVLKMQPKLDSVAYYWSPAAKQEFNEGYAEGWTAFMDKSARLTGETTRSETYAFLLLAWPEIRAMLESNPKKTLSDLHEWMLPFMRAGVTPYLDIEQLRDVCAPPPGGIGLSLRPLKSRPSPPSA